MLPVHFGPWQTVYGWFRRFVRRLLFRTIHDVAFMLEREAVGREASPTGGVLDGQVVKAPFAEVRGYDGGKRTVGRKRHIAVDTDGRLLMVNLTPADVSDSAGAQTILAAVRKRWPWLKHLFADPGYDRMTLMDKEAFLDFAVEIVRHSDPKGFHVLPRRWMVERTFGRMIRWRRLVRDDERRLDVSEAMIHAARAPSSCAGSPTTEFLHGHLDIHDPLIGRRASPRQCSPAGQIGYKVSLQLPPLKQCDQSKPKYRDERHDR